MGRVVLRFQLERRTQINAAGGPRPLAVHVNHTDATLAAAPDFCLPSGATSRADVAPLGSSLRRVRRGCLVGVPGFAFSRRAWWCASPAGIPRGSFRRPLCTPASRPVPRHGRRGDRRAAPCLASARTPARRRRASRWRPTRPRLAENSSTLHAVLLWCSDRSVEPFVEQDSTIMQAVAAAQHDASRRTPNACSPTRLRRWLPPGALTASNESAGGPAHRL